MLSDENGFFLLVGVVTGVTLACRLGGYFLMKFFPLTSRLDAALRATPIGVMVGIITPEIFSGVQQLLALGTVLLVMARFRDETMAALTGIAVIAACRLI